MSLRIRLSRGGAKKRPYYRIVVADSRSPRDGRFIERIGAYNPMVAKDHPERLNLDVDRAQYWLGRGAQPSDRVARFLEASGLGERVVPTQTKKHLPRAKAQERLREAEEKAAEAAAAAAEAAAEAAAAAAAPAEEAPAEEAPAEAPAEETAEETTEEQAAG